MNAKVLVLLLLPLAGCSSTSETQNMPVQILTAEPANAQATDMPKVEQTLRPKGRAGRDLPRQHQWLGGLPHSAR